MLVLDGKERMFLGKRFTDEEIAALEAAEKDIRDKRSYRHLQCLLLRAKHGKPAREIAELLGIAQRTVEEVHRRYFKLPLAEPAWVAQGQAPPPASQGQYRRAGAF